MTSIVTESRGIGKQKRGHRIFRDILFRFIFPCKYSSKIFDTTELVVLENASPMVRQQEGSRGREIT